MVSKYVKKHQNQRFYFDTVNSSIPAIYNENQFKLFNSK